LKTAGWNANLLAGARGVLGGWFADVLEGDGVARVANNLSHLIAAAVEGEEEALSIPPGVSLETTGKRESSRKTDFDAQVQSHFGGFAGHRGKAAPARPARSLLFLVVRTRPMSQPYFFLNATAG